MMFWVEPDVRTSDPRTVFEEMFRAHFLAVRSYVRRAWSSLDGEDIMSQTFEIAWRRLDDTPDDAPRGWLIGIARNCALNELRAKRRRADHLATLRADRNQLAAELFDDHLSADTVAALRQALGQLRPSDQEVVLLAAWGGLAGEDLGAALGTSGATAAVRLFRARERLRVAYSTVGGSG